MSERFRLRAINPPVVLTLSDEEADALAGLLVTMGAEGYDTTEEIHDSITTKLYNQLERAPRGGDADGE